VKPDDSSIQLFRSGGGSGKGLAQRQEGIIRYDRRVNVPGSDESQVRQLCDPESYL
jgi:hypothetical protein